jgi:hypothetical protein
MTPRAAVQETAPKSPLTEVRLSMSAIGATADKVGFWPAEVCPLLTQQRHHLCTAAMVLMLVSAPIKVLV